MNDNADNISSEKMRLWMSRLLRTGVITSVMLIITGGILFFIQHPHASFNFKVFMSEPSRLRLVTDIIHDAFLFRSRSVIQLGILVLIATPVMRVLFSLLEFIITRDKIYILITGIVFSLLLFSLIV